MNPESGQKMMSEPTKICHSHMDWGISCTSNCYPEQQHPLRLTTHPLLQLPVSLMDGELVGTNAGHVFAVLSYKQVALCVLAKSRKKSLHFSLM